MSSVYYNEPPNSGKVLIKTTIGDIEIDLWSKECPKACKNFINLCLSKYYHGTIFHRVVKGFIVQGGDPSGTGTGGEAYDSTPFADEFHQRLKFNRRGLVAMANAGSNDNRSQFFITLGACPELNNKHTIFGTVVNNTIFNVLKVEELELGTDDRPLIPPKILKTIVTDNPFKDKNTVKRDREKHRVEKYSDAFEHIKPVKNKKLLSFEDEEEEDLPVVKDPTLSKEPVLCPNDISVKLPPQQEKIKVPSEPIISDSVENHTETELERLKAEQDAIKEMLRSSKKRAKQMKAPQAIPKEVIDEQELLAGFGSLRRDFTANETISEYLLSNRKYAQRKKVLPILNSNDKREMLTLELLKSFESDLSKIQQKAILREKQRKGETDIDLSTETDWMGHLLTFEKPSPHISSAIDANVESLDRYDITDPRHPMNIRKNKTIQSKKE